VSFRNLSPSLAFYARLQGPALTAPPNTTGNACNHPFPSGRTLYDMRFPETLQLRGPRKQRFSTRLARTSGEICGHRMKR
jgi:hypothetical protein